MKITFKISAFLTVVLLTVFSACKSGSETERRSTPEEDKDSAETVVPIENDSLFAKVGFRFSSLDEAENVIVRKLDSVMSTGYEDPFRVNDQFKTILKSVDSTIDYDFPLLTENDYIDIYNSDDGNLRIYSLTVRQDGTMGSYENVCQYRSGDRIFTVCDSDKEIPSGISTFLYEGIGDLVTVKADNGETYYVVHTIFREMSNLGYARLVGLMIKDGTVQRVALFEGDNLSNQDDYETNATGQEYRFADWYEIANFGEGWDWIYSYDPDTRTFYVPQVDDYMELTDRYDLHQFNGKRFVRKGSGAGFWLHPSLGDFERLEKTFKTPHYTVRVDKIGLDSYRYASWNEGQTMKDEPAIVIRGGSRNPDTEDYEFTNGNYRYIVEDGYDCSLKVYRDNRLLLSEKRLEIE